MNINKISTGVIKGVKKISQNFQSCPIKLRQQAQDAFIKSQNQHVQEYLRAYSQNPNTAFLQHPSYSHAKILELLRNSDTVYDATQLKKLTGIPTGAWLDDRCFNVEWHRIDSTPSRRILDLSDPINARNIEFVQQARGHALDPETFRLNTGMDADTYQRYLKEGYLQRLQLQDKNTGEMVNLGLISQVSDINKAGIERFKKIHPQSGNLHKSLLKKRYALAMGRKAPVIATSQELTKLGFGSQYDLLTLVKSGKIEGEIKKGINKKGQKIMWAEIDLNNIKTMGVLEQLRRQTCSSIDSISNSMGISIGRLEDAILSGEILPIREKVLVSDTNTVLFNMTNPKNIAGFDKLYFEKIAHEELAHQAKKTRNAERSLQYKLAWRLSPNTQMNARQAFAQNKAYKGLQAEIEKIKELLSNPDLKPDEVENLENNLVQLYKAEDIELKKIFGAMWHESGTEEFRNSLQRAKQILEEVQKSGIDSIKNSDIRNFLITHQA